MPISFSSLGVSADLITCLERLGIAEPYPIQAVTVPDGLAGNDVLAQSPTGSGKTLSFAIPLVTRVGKARPARPRALVLAPTRELAAQIALEIRPLAAVKKRFVADFYGGTGFKEQLNALRRGVDIAVGCPGRLIDLLERGALDLSEVEIVVIDEADRMADMGFLPPVRQLLDRIRVEHQTMLFSATLGKEVERLVRDYQRAPKRHLLNAETDDVGSRTHEFWRSSREERVALTAQLVSTYSSSIVFCRTKRGVDRLARHLSQFGLVAVAIHGDRTQAQRDRALKQFRDRRAQVLVGTDVAARGLHVDNIDCVVHFDPPEDEDTYVHRSGRTGRAGASGLVVSILTADQEKGARQMQKQLGIAAQFRSAPTGTGFGAIDEHIASTPAGPRPALPGTGRPRVNTHRSDAGGSQFRSGVPRRRGPRPMSDSRQGPSDGSRRSSTNPRSRNRRAS